MTTNRSSNNSIYRYTSDNYTDPHTGQSIVLNSTHYSRRYYEQYTEMNSKYKSKADCMLWPMQYKSKMFRPRIRTDQGTTAYVQCLLLEMPSSEIHRVRNTCGHLWCCNEGHLEVKIS